MKLFIKIPLVFILFANSLCAQPSSLPRPEEYAARRFALLNMMDTTEACFLMAPTTHSEYDNMNFRQDPDFFYLSGINTPGAYMLFIPKGLRLGNVIKRCFLFRANSYLDDQNYPGNFMGRPDTVLATKEFRNIFEVAMTSIHKVWTSMPDFNFLYDPVNEKNYFLDLEVGKNFKKSHTGMSTGKATRLMARLREIKSKDELKLMRFAIEITGEGIHDAMKQCHPGIWEYELQAMVEYQFTRHGALRKAFPSIIGSGLNGLSPHYMENKAQTKEGDLIVMDVGAEYNGYAADITRTIPASGKFTGAQREVYTVVLQVQQELIRMIHPGLTMGEIDRKASQLIRKAGYGDCILHGVTHTVGLDVHDVQSSDTLRPGMVITIEPGIYIPSDDKKRPAAFQGMGIRIEDDVLVTQTGYEVLSAAVPKEIEEIESSMKK
jgi:Xaa-Pro aminopeptidase